ncbi:MAG: hypothetical protein HC905_30125 [Bacteroidales bacterium]|nr:hypothetical protein [Bacteroidales bacterium]
MKIKLLLLFYFFFQIISAKETPETSIHTVILLNNQQIIELRKLTDTDSQAKLAFKPLIDQAINALKDLPNPSDTIFYEGLVDFNPKRIETKKKVVRCR